MSKKCKYCGVDISHRSNKVWFCTKKECVDQGKRDRYNKKFPNTPRLCKNCKVDISHKFKKIEYCDKPLCHIIHVKERNKKWEEKNTSFKNCKKCNKKFLGNVRQNYCSKCRWNVPKKCEFVEVNYYCKECNVFVFSRIKQKSGKYFTKNRNNVYCKLCKEKRKDEIRKQRSERMKLNNPAFRQKKRKKYIPLHKKMGFSSYSEYMKVFNPMKNKKTSERLSKTLKEKYKNGEIKKKYGKDNPRFLGNRPINKSIRDDLKEWRIEILKKYDYKCAICKINNDKLHIHHTTPLKDIINLVCKLNNVLMKDVEIGSKLFLKIKNEVVKYHFDNDVGIVLCIKHHDELDKYYHPPKNEK